MTALIECGHVRVMGPTPFDAKRVEHSERIVSRARAETDAAIQLRREIASIVEGTVGQIAAIECEARAGIIAALATYQAARAFLSTTTLTKPSRRR